MNNTKRNEKINELESIETVLGITKAEYAAEKLLEQYEKTGLQTETLFDRLSSMSDEEIIMQDNLMQKRQLLILKFQVR